MREKEAKSVETPGIIANYPGRAWIYWHSCPQAELEAVKAVMKMESLTRTTAKNLAERSQAGILIHIS